MADDVTEVDADVVTVVVTELDTVDDTEVVAVLLCDVVADVLIVLDALDVTDVVAVLVTDEVAELVTVEVTVVCSHSRKSPARYPSIASLIAFTVTAQLLNPAPR